MIAYDLGNVSTVPITLRPEVFGRASDIPLYIDKKDLLDISVSYDCLNISILQLWCRYVYHQLMYVILSNVHL